MCLVVSGATASLIEKEKVDRANGQNIAEADHKKIIAMASNLDIFWGKEANDNGEKAA